MEAESALQELLLESPSLIPINDIKEDISSLVYAVKEFPLPNSGSIDLLAFSPEGNIAIVECKLATNPEAKRKVIGQILEYAAYLWGMSFEELNSRVQEKSGGKNLTDLIREYAGEEWDEESFRLEVEESLKNGSFTLIIAVDEINEELKRIIQYINECSNTSFSLHALEMKLFKKDKIEILVPHLYGVISKPPSKKTKIWTEEEFFKYLVERATPKVVQIIRDLYDWGRNTVEEVTFGRGGTYPTCRFDYSISGKRTSVFSIELRDPPILYLGFGALYSRMEDEEFKEKLLKEFHRKLQEIDVFRGIAAEFKGKYPSIRITDNFDKYVNQFKQVIEWLGDQVKDSK